MFSFNKALAGGAVATVSDWIGGALAHGANSAATTYLDYPMPQTVETGLQTLLSALLVAAVVYLIPNASKQPAAPAGDNEHA